MHTKQIIALVVVGLTLEVFEQNYV